MAKNNEGLPNLPFRWEALSKLEQSVMFQLAKVDFSMPAFEIYLRTCNAIYFKQEKGATTWKVDNGIFTPLMPKKTLTGEFHLPLYKMKKTEALALLDELRDNGNDIPFFPLVSRMLDNFAKLKWVEKRETTSGKAAAFFYLPTNIKENVLNAVKK